MRSRGCPLAAPRCAPRTSCTPRQAAGRSSQAGRAHRLCPSRAGGSGTAPCSDRSPPAPGLNRRGCNHKLWETKYKFHPGTGLADGAPGLSPHNVEGHILLIKQGSKRLSPCSPGYLQGRTAAERGGKRPFLSIGTNSDHHSAPKPTGHPLSTLCLHRWEEFGCSGTQRSRASPRGRTYVHTSRRDREPARPRRSRADTSRSARPSCCRGSVGSGRTQSRSSPRH